MTSASVARERGPTPPANAVNRAGGGGGASAAATEERGGSRSKCRVRERGCATQRPAERARNDPPAAAAEAVNWHAGAGPPRIPFPGPPPVLLPVLARLFPVRNASPMEEKARMREVWFAAATGQCGAK